MNAIQSIMPGVVMLEPRVYTDERGFFFESWSQERYARAGLPQRFVQDNVSFSHRGVLRGLHYQHPRGQGKLLCVLLGEVFDVAVDVRVGSPTFGQWQGWCLSRENGRQLYLPPGVAHGFLVTGEDAIVSYKCTEYYDAEAEATIRWDDETIQIRWPDGARVLSEKDRNGWKLRDIPVDRLPKFENA